MAKYLEHDGQGSAREVQPVNVSGGAPDAGKMVQLDPSGRISETMLPVGIGADTASLEASEALLAGDYVNIWNDAGTTKVRKAVASSPGTAAHGFVLAAVSAGSQATVYFEGTNNQLSGMTGGSKQFLSASTAGESTDTAPTTSGNIVQILGMAYSATELAYEATNPIELV
jgi:hypothetical protein